MEIQISGQYGDPQADDIFWPMQKKLNDYFKKYIIGGYFKRITKNRNSVSNIRQDMGL